MGYIYKITNKQNNKIYIGQTRINVNNRWRTHCAVSYNKNNEEYNFAFHRAIRKYGPSNFLVETIEECSDNNLNDREKYWIAYYNSYKDGYNESLGGDGHTKYNYDNIVNYYLNHDFSIKDTCIHFQIYDQVVYSALQSKNINYKELNKRKNGIKKIGKKILLVEKNIIFNNMSEIDKYFGKVVHPNIRRCLNGVTKKAYGYTWKEVDNNE